MFDLLEGVRAIDFSTAAAGPACGKVLADFGAEVIQVEPIEGTRTRTDTYYYDFWCGNKKSLPVNAKTKEGQQLIYRLVQSADIFFTNFRIKPLQRLGLDYESLKAVNPSIVYGLLTGWGEEGPIRDNPGFDVVCYWARSGLLRDMAEQGQICVPPQGVGDTATGQALAGALCAALFKKMRTGKGCKVDISLYGESIFVNNFQNITSQLGEKFQKSRLAPREAMSNTYRCSDGWIVFYQNDMRRFGALMTAIGREDLADDPRWKTIDDTRFDGAPELVQIFDEAFAKMTTKEAAAALRKIDVAVEICWGSGATANDDQASINHNYMDWTFTNGEKKGCAIRLPVDPIHVNGQSAELDYKGGPKLGEHSFSILRGIGYTDEQIQKLAADQMIVAL